MTFVSIRRTIASVFAAFLLLTAPACADSLIDAAKAGGVIGERIDGYLGFVNTPGQDGELKRRVAEINAQRREVYTRLAERTGQSVSTIAVLTAEKQISKARSGEYVMKPSGDWVKK